MILQSPPQNPRKNALYFLLSNMQRYALYYSLS
jgi:hypothetical protein